MHVSDEVLADEVAAPDESKGTYAFVSLGCAKNLVDSERIVMKR